MSQGATEAAVDGVLHTVSTRSSGECLMLHAVHESVKRSTWVVFDTVNKCGSADIGQVFSHVTVSELRTRRSLAPRRSLFHTAGMR